MWENNNKFLKAFFSNPATVQIAFLPGQDPCFFSVHHYLSSGAVGEFQLEKNPRAGLNQSRKLPATVPAEAGTTVALPNGKEKRRLQSSTQTGSIWAQMENTKGTKITQFARGQIGSSHTMRVENPSHYGIHLLPPKKNNAGKIKSSLF